MSQQNDDDSHVQFMEELLPDDIPAAHDEFNNNDLGNENDIFESLGHEDNDSDSENEIQYERRGDDNNDDRPLYLGAEITKREKAPVINLIQEMYGRRDFFNSLQRRFDGPDHPNVISDVYDSQLYKQWVNNGFLSNPHNVSFS
ncbi:hypothetical protein PV328_001204 [Microctonus aethiopoides]|uniref:Uncharacterized protein n=1 Tax=Microctonus aethiopoides TaxID=144406 RepID=A0AA39FX68_9HYME|nr:hypothetical protein PV328_001204 [Microctonus aethiopoides]